MNWIEAIILGIVQGLTEFLPVSSSAHLRVVGEFLPGASDPGAAFTAITQIGTELAVLLYFWRDITRIITQWCRALVGKIPQSDPDVRIGWLIIIGSIPIGVLGLLFEDAIDTSFRSLWLVATMLIFFGVLLAIADAWGRHIKPISRLSWRDGILYGLAQALALIPGVSRSGGTITIIRLLDALDPDRRRAHIHRRQQHLRDLVESNGRSRDRGTADHHQITVQPDEHVVRREDSTLTQGGRRRITLRQLLPSGPLRI